MNACKDGLPYKGRQCKGEGEKPVGLSTCWTHGEPLEEYFFRLQGVTGQWSTEIQNNTIDISQKIKVRRPLLWFISWMEADGTNPSTKAVEVTCYSLVPVNCIVVPLEK